MVTLKFQIKELEENKIDIKLIVPKDVSKATTMEKDLAKYFTEQINKMFDKKENN